MPLQATSGAASYDAFGGGVPVVPAYIEEVFGTYLYTGNDTVQTITNGIDLSTKGGAVFIKSRNLTSPTVVYDTNRGINKALCTNLTNAENVGTLGTNQDLNAFNTNGFAVNLFTNAGGGFGINNSAHNLASWTFRKQPKFFDVVTWTGTGSDPLTINHNLQSVPGCIIVKCTSAVTNWRVHSTALDMTLVLNATNAGFSPDFLIKNLTSTTFQVNNSADVNSAGATYVAYLFAHNAGGFGLTGTDNVISCGSFTGGDTVNLGYEPQWLMWKRSDNLGNWFMLDTMRGWTADGNDNYLQANTTATETNISPWPYPTATGFTAQNQTSSGTFIYIAIRRGPMKVPTDATKVFAIDTRHASTPSFVSNFPVDMSTYRAKSGSDWYIQSRLTPKYMFTNATDAEAGYVFGATQFAYNTGWGTSGADIPDLFSYMWQRAPLFFDEVCFGSSPTTAIPHNLAAIPELIIAKDRSGSGAWYVWQPSTSVRYGTLNTSSAFSAPAGSWPATSTTFEPLIYGSNIVNYLFATCAGVSKVGSYTGNGSSQTINCGFTGGARFVLIKKTSGTGSWYVWDSARGIVSGNDPYLLLNSTAAEVTNTDYIDTYSAGFEISSTAPSEINENGGSFIFLAIA
jgi:hypothetical protein